MGHKPQWGEEEHKTIGQNGLALKTAHFSGPFQIHAEGSWKKPV